jgi:hypothetical protein
MSYVNISAWRDKELGPQLGGGSNYPGSGLVKPPRRDTRALSPAGMFGGKAPLRLAAQKNRPHSPQAPMRSTPAYSPFKWGVKTRIDKHSEQARAPHTKGPRDVPRCGALSLLQKPLHYKWGSAKIVPAFAYVSIGPVVTRARV